MKKFIHAFVGLFVMFIAFQQTHAQGTTIANATALTVGSGNGTATGTGPAFATAFACSPTSGYATGCQSVGWYTITVGAAATVTLDFQSTPAANDQDIFAVVFSANSCSTTDVDDLADLDCDRDGLGGIQVSFDAAEQRTYYVMIGDFNCNDADGFTFDYTMTETPLPAVNDEPCTATQVPFSNGCSSCVVTGTIGDYTESCVTGDPIDSVADCGSGSSSFDGENACRDAWYTVTVPTSGNVDITLVSLAGSTDLTMAVYTGITCANTDMTFVACDDDSGVGSLPELNLTGLTPGDILYIRVWDFNCDSPTAQFEMSVTAGAPILLNAATDGSTVNLNCGTPQLFYDSGGAGIANGATDYANNEDFSMTFCATPGNVVRMSFLNIWNSTVSTGTIVRPACDGTHAADLDAGGSTTGGGDLADYLTFHDGTTLGDPVITVNTGETLSYPSPGTIVSSGACLTVRFQSSQATVEEGWEAVIECVADITPTSTNISCAAGDTFTDDNFNSGGQTDIQPDDQYVTTFCPDIAGACIFAGDLAGFLTGINLNPNVDYMYVYNGTDDTSSPIAIFTGSSDNVLGNGVETLTNITGITAFNDWAPANPGGCLTFKVVSNNVCNYPNWQSNVGGFSIPIECVECDLGNGGGADCATATCINANGFWAGTNIDDTGNGYDGVFNGGGTDPGESGGTGNYTIDCIDASGVGTSEVTRLENTIWYQFSTPDICEELNLQILLNYISCQNERADDNGIQFVIWEGPVGAGTGCLGACPSLGDGWDNDAAGGVINAPGVSNGYDMFGCFDKLVAGQGVSVSNLNSNTHYYIMIDGFTGQHCFFDFYFDLFPPGITAPAVVPDPALFCSGSADAGSFSVTALDFVEFVYDPTPYASVAMAQASISAANAYDNFSGGPTSLGVEANVGDPNNPSAVTTATTNFTGATFPVNNTCAIQVYNLYAIADDFPAGGYGNGADATADDCFPFQVTQITIYPSFTVTTDGDGTCGTLTAVLEATDGTDCETATAVSCAADGDVLNYDFSASTTVTNLGAPPASCALPSLSGTLTCAGCAPTSCACPTCPSPPGTTAVQISGCPVEEGTYADQAAQDAAADGTAANPFATWNAALAFAQGNGINHIQFAPGTYQTDNSVFNAFGLAGGWPVTSNNMYVDGQGATIIGNGTSVGFADVNANSVTFANLNLTNFAQALELEDIAGFTYCNGIIDGSDNNALNGVFINSDAVNTDATFINVDFNNHDTPNFTSAMDIFASSVTEAINTTVTFCDSEWNCNQRDGFGGALFIGHGGGRGNPAWAGPIVCMQDGGFYDNLGIGNASDGGALNVQDNSTLTIDGTEFVCNDTNNNTGTSGGGAIRIQGGADVDIQNANFTGNTTTQYGGAILFTVANAADPALTISNTVFWNNTAERGGGLYSGSETTTTVDGCYFEGNSSTGTNFAAGGGGIYIDAGPQATGNPDQTVFNLLNSTVTANTSADDSAGGMFVYEAETSSDDPPGSGQEDIITITNSVLCNNTSTNAPEADLSEDAYEPFLATGFSSITIDAASIIGNGLADNGVTNAADRDLSQGDCGNTVGIGYTTAPPAALACPACPATPATTSNCDQCLADAGNMVRPTGGLLDPVTGNQTICIGDNLGDWAVDYNDNGATDETQPPGTYDIALILTDASDNIVQVNYTGAFDFSILGVGTYNVYSLSYSPDNTPNNIAAYLAQLSSGVADGIGSNVSEIIADDDDASSGGAGTGSFCLDIDNLDDLGLDSESQVVQVTIVEPLDAGDNGTAVACNDNTEGTSTVNLDGALLGTPDTGGTWTITTDPSGGGVAIGAGNVVDFNGLAVGTYIFTYTVTSAPCPDDSATVTIGVSDCNTCTAFNATLAGTSTVCEDNTASNLTVTMDGGTGPYEVIYSDGSSNIIIFTYNSGDNIPVAPAVTTNYTLVSVEDTNGCPATLAGAGMVTVNNNVNAGIDGTDAACNDNTEGTSTVDLDDALLGTPDAGGAWVITTDPSGSASIGAGNVVDFNGLAAGSYVFTYTVTATAPCTDDSATVTVDVTDCDPCPAINATLAGDATVCEDNTASNLTVTIVGGAAPYQVVYSNGSTNTIVTGYNSGDNIAVSPSATTNYTLVSVEDANGCPATVAGSATITVNTLVDAGENGTDAACNDNTEGTSTVDLDDALLGAPDAGGAWAITTDPSGSASIGAGNVVDFNGLTAGSYVFTYTVTATAPCTDDSATVTVDVTDCDPCPAINATLAGDATVCEDNTVSNLTVTIVGGTGPYDVIYSDGSSNTIVMSYNSGDNIAVSPSATTNYTLVSIEDANGCPATVAGSATVTVNTLVDAGINNTVNTCNTTADGSTVDLFGSILGNPDTGGAWAETSGVSSGVAIPAGDLSGGTTIDFDGVAVGSYTFQYTVSATAPCTDDTAIITVNVQDCTTPTCPNITATLAGDATVCEDNTASNLTVTIVGGASPYEVVYSNGILNSVVFSYNSGDNIPVSPNATTNYTLVSVTDANDCPATLAGSATITVNTLVDAGENGTDTACNDNTEGTTTVDLDDALLGTPEAGGAWAITTDPSGSASIGAGNVVDFNGLAAGSYVFTYTVTGTAPCTDDSATVTVTVADCDQCPAITATLAGDNTVCEDNTASNLTVTIVGGTAPYEVVYNSGVFNTVVFTYNSGDNIPVSPSATTNYTLVSVEDANGCPATLAGTATITVNTLPNAGVDETVNTCNTTADGSTVDLFGSLTGSPDTGGSWSETSGVSSGVAIPAGDLSGGTTIDFNGVTVGTYTFQYTAPGTAPCADDVSVVTVNVADCTTPTCPNITATLTGDATVCEDNTASNLTVTILGGTAPYEVVYNTGLFNSVVFGYNSGDNIPVMPNATTNYTLVSVEDANGCPATLSGSPTIIVNTLPNAGIDGMATTCNTTADGSTVDLFGSLTGSQDTGGSWTETSGVSSGIAIPAGDLSGGTTIDFDGVAVGTYTFQYTVAGTAPCADDVSVVTVNVQDCTSSIDLTLIKTVDNPTPLVGETVLFTITIANNGPDPATGVEVADYIPTGYTNIANISNSGILSGSTINWAAVNLAVGESTDYTFEAEVTAINDYVNVAEITAHDQPDIDSTPNDGVDPDGDGNIGSEDADSSQDTDSTNEDDSDDALVTPPLIDLNLTKVVDNATPNVGGTVTFTITVSNDGPDDATGVEITDVVPNGYANITNISNSGGLFGGNNIVWSGLSIANGGSIVLTFDAEVLGSGDYVNIAEVTDANQTDVDSTPDNGADTDGDGNIGSQDPDANQDADDEDDGDDAEVNPVTPPVDQIDLNLTKVVDNTTPNVGGTVTFTITVSNDGPDDATGVEITDVVPTGYANITNISNSGGLFGGNNIVWSGLSIANGGSIALTFDAEILGSGDYVNIAEVTDADQTDVDSTPDNGADTDGDGNIGSQDPDANQDADDEDDGDDAEVNPVTPVELIDLNLTKVVDNTTPNVGGTVTFTITVSNDGPDDATGVEITDVVPSGYANITNISNSGGLFGGNNIVWGGLSIANGASIALTFDAEVLGSGDYVNIAEVTAADQTDVDSTPGNGADTDGDGNIGSQDPDANQDADDEDDGDDAEVNPVTPPADQIDLNLTKVVDNMTPAVGATVTFTITVSNDGPDDATGVEITDVVPAGYTNITNISSGGGLFGGNNIVWGGLSIANGGSIALTFDAEVTATANYVNVAEVTAADQTDIDSTPGNGADTDSDGNIGSQDPDANQDADDEDDGDDAWVIPSTPVDQIDLWLTKTVNNPTPNVGDMVSFTITVTNDGPDAATGVAISDYVPSGYANVTNISNGGGLFGGSTIVWNGISLANGASIVLTFDAEVLASGDYVNVAEITAHDQGDIDSVPNDGVDPDGDGNIGSEDPDSSQDTDSTNEDDSDDALVIPTQIDLSLIKTVDNASPVIGGTVTFTITVSNDGPDDATGVAVQDIVPAGYTNITNISSGGIATANVIDWTGLNIPNGGSVSLTFDAEVTSFPDYVNIAEVTAADQTDIDSIPNNGADNDNDGDIGSEDTDGTQDADDEDDGDDAVVNPTVPLQTIDLNLTKVVDNPTPAVGGTVTFTITVSNDGPDDATGVEITDVVPSGYTNITNISNSGGLFGGNTIIWGGLSIANGASVSLTFDAEVTGTANYVNIAEVTDADQADSDSTPGNGADTDGDGNIGSQDPDANQDADDEDDGDDATVTPSTPVDLIDLWLVKTVNNATPNIGDVVSFTITVTNDGPDTATGVEVSDYVPAGYTNIANISNGGGLFGGNTIVWDGISLANGANIVLTFDAEVTATADYVNVAEVTAHDQGDIDSVPNDGVDPDGDGNIGSEDADSSQDTDSTNEDDSDDALVTPNPPTQLIDLNLTKVVDNATPNVGDLVTFTITVTNDGPDDATNVEVHDALPSGYDYTFNTASAGIYSDATALWQIPFIANGTSETLGITVEVLGSGDYVNIAEIIGADQPDSDSTPDNGADTDGDGDIGSQDPDDNQDPDDEDDGDDATVTPVIPAVIDLNLTKVVSNTTPTVGSTVTFTITVSNDGPDDATGVEVTDEVPNGYANITNISNGGGLFAGNTIVWAGLNVANGASVSLTFDAEVLASGDHVNIAEITDADQPDSDSTPDNGADTDGDGDIGSQDPDENQDPDDEDDGDDASVTPIQPVNLIDLNLVKSVNNTTPTVGSTVTFTITVSNDGPDDATGVEITDVVPNGYANISNISNGGGLFAGNTIVWSGLNVANGASVSLTFDAEVLASGNHINIAEITDADQPDSDSTPDNGADTDGDGDIGSQDPDDNQDPDDEDDGDDASVTPIQPVNLIDLNLVKSVSNATPTVGSTVTFTITVSNDGPDDATGVEVTDVVPTGYANITNISNGGGLFAGNTIVWTGLNVANGGSVSLTFDAEVLASGNHTNIAEITDADQPDSDSTPDNGADTDGDGDIGSQDPDDNQDPDDEDDGDDASVTPIQPELIDLSLTKVVDNATPNVGDLVTFTITVTNDGPDDATNVEVHDALPSGYDYTFNTASAGIYSDATALWQIPFIANGTSETLGITVEVLGSGDYLNIAEITAADQDDVDSTPDNGADTDGDGNIGSEDPDDNQDSDDEDDGDDASVTPNPPTPLIDLSLVKTASPMVAEAGETITFTIAVTNSGPDDATGVEVTDMVPSGYTNIANISNGGGLFGGNTVVWDDLAIANGETVMLTFEAEILASGNYTNIAEVTAADQDDPDSTPGNGADTDGDGDIGSEDPDGSQDDDDEDDGDDATVTLFEPPVLVDLELSKTVDNPTPEIDETVTFTITVNNEGGTTATGIIVEELLPSGYTYASHNTSQGTYNPITGLWNIGTMLADAAETLNVEVVVLGTGDYLNVAEIVATNETDIDSTPDNNDGEEDDQDDAIVDPQEPTLLIDLSLVKVVDNETPTIGENVTFTLTVNNAGPDIATGVMVQDFLPSGYEFVNSTGDQAVYDHTNGIWWVDSLMVGESQSIDITAEVLATGDYVNIADIVNANEPDIDSTPNNDVDPDGDGNIGSEDTDGTQDPDEEDDADDAVVIPATPVIDLELTKTISDSSPIVGDVVTFTIELSNNGPDNATGVSVADYMPNGYSYAGHLTTAGNFNPFTGIWTVGAVNANETETLSIDVIVLDGGNYVNIAEVIGADQDDSDSTPNNDDEEEDDQDSAGPDSVNPACDDFEVTAEIECNNDEGTYDIVLTSNLDETNAALGFTITNNLTGTSDVNASLPIVLGPFNAGTGFNYTISANANPSCQSTVEASIVTCVVTAVELLRFEGEPLTDANHLNWVTATEFDNDYFELTKSTDGVNFKPIATIAAVGNSSVQTAYSFNDSEIEAGKVYYQLVMVDVDGSRTQSNIVEIERQAAIQMVTVMPNPVSNVSWVNIQSTTNQQAQLNLYDVSGKLITNQLVEISQGTNQVELNFNTLPNGVYMLAVKLQNQQTDFVKIVKQ